MRKIKSMCVFMLLMTALFLTSCSERIDAGSEGILVNLYGSDKGVDDVSLVTGRVWYNPFTEEVYEYPTFVQTIDYPAFTINAKDGSEFTVEPTVSLKMIDGNAPKVFKKYRKDLNDIIHECFKDGVFRIGEKYGYEFCNSIEGNLVFQEVVFESPREAFASKINEETGLNAWRSNPYMFVYDFKLIKDGTNEKR